MLRTLFQTSPKLGRGTVVCQVTVQAMGQCGGIRVWACLQPHLSLTSGGQQADFLSCLCLCFLLCRWGSTQIRCPMGRQWGPAHGGSTTGTGTQGAKSMSAITRDRSHLSTVSRAATTQSHPSLAMHPKAHAHFISEGACTVGRGVVEMPLPKIGHLLCDHRG